MAGDSKFIEEAKLGDRSLESDPFEGHASKKIVEREDEYHAGRHRRRELSPSRADPFSNQGLTGTKRTYKDIMEEQNLSNEQADLIRELKKKQDLADQQTKRQRTEDQIDSSKDFDKPA